VEEAMDEHCETENCPNPKYVNNDYCPECLAKVMVTYQTLLFTKENRAYKYEQDALIAN
jgi:hypothetical protein